MYGFGPLQRQIRRAFLAEPGVELTTGDLIRWCYPRLAKPARNKHRFAIRRAAEIVAERAGVGWRGSIIWREKQSPVLPRMPNGPAIKKKSDSKQRD
jgi:hypothetical protein